MSDYVPGSPTSVASSHPIGDGPLDWPDDWSDGIPLEVDEDVLVPYWENLHEDLFLDEAVLRQFVCTYERQERDLWNYLGPE